MKIFVEQVDQEGKKLKKVIALWENKSKDGKIYYTGKLNQVRLVGRIDGIVLINKDKSIEEIIEIIKSDKYLMDEIKEMGIIEIIKSDKYLMDEIKEMGITDEGVIEYIDNVILILKSKRR